MVQQRVIWTVLPNGVSDNGKLKLSIFVSPRLDPKGTDETLASFPDFLDWPGKVRDILNAGQMSLRIEPSIPDLRIERVAEPDLDSNLWKAFFDKTTRICSYSYQSFADPGQITTYSVKDAHQAIKSIYGRETGFGYADRSLPTTRIETIGVDVPVIETVPISEVIREILYSHPSGAFPTISGEIENDFLAVLSYVIPDVRAKDPTIPELPWAGALITNDLIPSIADVFTQICVLKIQSNVKFEPGLTASHLNPRVMQTWLAYFGNRERDPQLKLYFFMLAQGVDPQISEIQRTTSKHEQIEKVVPIPNPSRARGDDLAKEIRAVGDPISSFYAQPKPPPPLEPPSDCFFDFHTIVGSLGQYPFLLRKLGLILDVEVALDPELVQKAMPNPLQASLLVNWKKDDPSHFNATPSTICALAINDGHLKNFRAQSRDSSVIQHGFLKVAPTITIARFSNTGLQAAHPTAEVIVPPGYKIIGGGARVLWSGEGAYLTSSYPDPDNPQKWIATAKDHVIAAPSSMVVSAVALFDPEDLWDVHVWSNTGEMAQHPVSRVQVPPEYVMLGGGAKVTSTGPGNLLTASYPAALDTWEARGKDVREESQATITVYAIGIKPKNGDVYPGLLSTKLFSNQSSKEAHPRARVRIDDGYDLLCGGAFVDNQHYGQLLMASSPDPDDPRAWVAESKEHLDPWPEVLSVYALGISHGQIGVSHTQFELVPIDVDGAALKLVQFSEALKGMSDAAIFKNGEFTGLPSLRTAGFGLAQNGRRESLAALSQLADNNNANLSADDPLPLAPLFLEDVMRGFRVDIQDQNHPDAWRSLMQRSGVYDIATQQPIQLTHNDEGWIAPTITTQQDEQGQLNKKLLHESIFKWEGWSLGVPRLGNVVTTEEPKPVAHNQLTAPEDQKKSIPLRFTAAPVKGTLPRLRFGREYRLRARAVDLAGNGLPLDAPSDEETESQMIKFRRFEPLPSPAVVLGQELNQETERGAAIDRLVIRTTNTAPEQDILKIDTTAERYIAPARTSQNMAEMHGVFDTAIGTNAQSTEITRVFNQIKDNDASVFEKSASGDMIIPASNALAPDGTLQLFYLPDPAVKELALINLPGAPAEQIGAIEGDSLKYQRVYSDVVGYLQASVTKIPLYEGTLWPNARPFKLSLVEGADQPQWDASGRVLTVYLPKAHTATIRLSSLGDTSDHGLLQWYREYLDEHPPTDKTRREALQDVMDAVNHGLHRLITPAREITLVHAVQQPIGAPKIEELIVKQLFDENGAEKEYGAKAGNTFVTLMAEFWTHAYSSAKLDLIASWTKIVDDPFASTRPDLEANASTRPDLEAKFSQHVLEQRIPLESDALQTTEQDGVVLMFSEEAGSDPNSPTEKSYYNFVSENVGIKRDVWHEFGDTKYRHVKYKTIATSRFGEFFPPPDGSLLSYFTRQSEDHELDIPNRARPSTPKPALVIPTFRWVRTTDEKTQTVQSQRFCGLRIFLERPWYSSGDGELLGILTSIVPKRDKNDQAVNTGFEGDEWTEGEPRVSHWGADPIWVTNQVWKLQAADVVEPEVVVDAVWDENEAKTNYELNTALANSDSSLRAQVSCYSVHYDSERQQWFADVEFRNDDLYFPFIRLALVRYQPISVPRQHFSDVTLADFAQLPPNRALVCRPAIGESNTKEIVLTGSSYSGRAKAQDGEETAETSRVDVFVQQRVRGLADPDLDWKDIEGSRITLSSMLDSSSGQTQWSGRLKLPARQAENEYRIVIEELEVFDAPAASHADVDSPTSRVTFIETIAVG